ncbi:hypothetical protein FOC33_17045 [Plesiomonas shigelloides]|uniref:hypothetical protein n=1 Tax=Plesiomonas shigelloides TaxID=703 RepID=UPI00143E7A49|nr:hypothetical protein [Plesiomonas shigelloides]MDT1012873.1 hypothetical protein [Plesiomonas shigelloides]QIY07478.1 hypothetical protein FOC33_00125 [Plesiomonas shigelloides]QIY10448.1 hypothetical protein FOC33_17045 [Plesiomonas shigelloides]
MGNSSKISTGINECALDALLKLNELTNLVLEEKTINAYHTCKSKIDNTVNTKQMMEILDSLDIPHELRRTYDNVDNISLIYIRYKHAPNGVKHWVTKYEDKIYDSIPTPSAIEANEFFKINPAYAFSMALNLTI